MLLTTNKLSNIRQAFGDFFVVKRLYYLNWIAEVSAAYFLARIEVDRNAVYGWLV